MLGRPSLAAPFDFTVRLSPERQAESRVSPGCPLPLGCASSVAKQHTLLAASSLKPDATACLHNR